MPELITREDAPEVVFRGVLPSDVLLALAREQDALLHTMLHAMPTARRIVIARGPGRYLVSARGEVSGREVVGEAMDAKPELALQHAYSELLRATLESRVAA